MRRVLFLCAGGISLSLGIVGIFVPVLPTTPFLLLAAFCFLRSSARLHHWLTHHRLFGAYIRNYLKYRAVSARAKVLSLIVLWLTILLSVIFVIRAWWLRIVLLLVASAVSIHLLRLRTLTREMIEGSDEKDGPPG